MPIASDLRVVDADLRPLDWVESTELAIKDSSLPVRIFFRPVGGPSLSPEAGVASFGPERHHDGTLEVVWHPFQRPEDKEGAEWAGRISYGPVRIRLEDDRGVETLTLRVGPSGLSGSQIGAMRHTIACVASELLVRRGEGTTRSDVGLCFERPRAWGHVLDQLRRFLEGETDMAAVVESICRSPLACMAPVRRPSHRPPPDRGARAQALDTMDLPENRIVGHAARCWQSLLLTCARVAEDEARRLEERVEGEPPSGAVRPSPNYLKVRRDEIARIREDAGVAKRIALRLAAAAGPLARLPAPSGALVGSPRTRRDWRYAHVLRIWARVRRECVLVAPARTATQRDLPASFLYEQWVLLSLVACLRRLGWTLATDDWLEAVPGGTYEVRLRRGEPWVLHRGEETLEVWYEPVLHPGRTKRSGSRGSPSLLERAMSNVATSPPSSLTFYSAKSTFTPDFVLLLTTASGEVALCVGDAIFVQVRDADHPDAPRPGSDRRMDQLRKKAEKVHVNYSRETFAAIPARGLVRAVEDLSFVVFPGPVAAYDWFEKVYEDVVALPLEPHPAVEEGALGIRDLSAVLRIVDRLLASLRDCAEAPRPFAAAAPVQAAAPAAAPLRSQEGTEPTR